MDKRFEVGAPMPSSLGLCADLHHEVESIRLEMQRQTNEVKAREKEIEEYIIQQGSVKDDTGWAGLRYRAQIKSETTFRVADWPAFHAWVLKNERLDMLEKRPSKKAVEDYIEQTGFPDGTELFKYKKLSVTKI